MKKLDYWISIITIFVFGAGTIGVINMNALNWTTVILIILAGYVSIRLAIVSRQ